MGTLDVKDETHSSLPKGAKRNLAPAIWKRDHQAENSDGLDLCGACVKEGGLSNYTCGFSHPAKVHKLVSALEIHSRL